MSHTQDLHLLHSIFPEVETSETFQELCRENNISPEILWLIPMQFADLEVSARTNHGIIYFNSNLKEKPEELGHYICHEMTHFFQQCLNDQPAISSNNEKDYLFNPDEQEGFQTQTQFIAETQGLGEAHNYIEQVLRHHEIPQEEWPEQKEQLMN